MDQTTSPQQQLPGLAAPPAASAEADANTLLAMLAQFITMNAAPPTSASSTAAVDSSNTSPQLPQSTTASGGQLPPATRSRKRRGDAGTGTVSTAKSFKVSNPLVEALEDDGAILGPDSADCPPLALLGPPAKTTRRQRAKHAIVDPSELIDPQLLPGTMVMDQAQFDAAVYDNETALKFAAKVGLIKNVRRCPKCSRDMALCRFNNSCGYRWVCRRTQEGKRFTCSVRGMRRDTILDDRLVGILTMLRIMYLFSQNIPADEIINRLDIGHVRSARTILTRLREMMDKELRELTLLPDAVTDEIADAMRYTFFNNAQFDNFGFILMWGTRYKPQDKQSPASSPAHDAGLGPHALPTPLPSTPLEAAVAALFDAANNGNVVAGIDIAAVLAAAPSGDSEEKQPPASPALSEDSTQASSSPSPSLKDPEEPSPSSYPPVVEPKIEV